MHRSGKTISRSRVTTPSLSSFRANRMTASRRARSIVIPVEVHAGARCGFRRRLIVGNPGERRPIQSLTVCNDVVLHLRRRVQARCSLEDHDLDTVASVGEDRPERAVTRRLEVMIEVVAAGEHDEDRHAPCDQRFDAVKEAARLASRLPARDLLPLGSGCPDDLSPEVLPRGTIYQRSNAEPANAPLERGMPSGRWRTAASKWSSSRTGGREQDDPRQRRRARRASQRRCGSRSSAARTNERKGGSDRRYADYRGAFRGIRVRRGRRGERAQALPRARPIDSQIDSTVADDGGGQLCPNLVSSRAREPARRHRTGCPRNSGATDCGRLSRANNVCAFAVM